MIELYRSVQYGQGVAKQVPSSISTHTSTPQADTTTPSGRSDRKRSSILKAAREVFLAQGFQSASMETVAAEAGVSKVTIYAKFGSKHDLFSAIVDEICEQILAIEIVIPETMESTRQGLSDLAVNYARVLFDPDVLALVRLAIGENQARPDLGQVYNATGPQRARKGLVELFASLNARGELRIDDLELAADQFLALIQPQRFYVLLDPSAAPSSDEVEHVARAGVDVFLSHYG